MVCTVQKHKWALTDGRRDTMETEVCTRWRNKSRTNKENPFEILAWGPMSRTENDI